MAKEGGGGGGELADWFFTLSQPRKSYQGETEFHKSQNKSLIYT